MELIPFQHTDPCKHYVWKPRWHPEGSNQVPPIRADFNIFKINMSTFRGLETRWKDSTMCPRPPLAKKEFFLKNRKKPGHLIDEKNWHIVEKKGAKKTSLQSVFLYFLKEVVRDPEAYCKQKLSWHFVEKWQVGWQFVEKKPWSWHPIEFFFLQSVKAIKTPPK